MDDLPEDSIETLAEVYRAPFGRITPSPFAIGAKPITVPMNSAETGGNPAHEIAAAWAAVNALKSKSYAPPLPCRAPEIRSFARYRERKVPVTSNTGNAPPCPVAATPLREHMLLSLLN